MKLSTDYDRIDLQFGYLIPGHDKITLSLKGKEYHYTMSIGSKSKVLDIHRTSHEKIKDQNPHRTIYKIPHRNIPRLMNELHPNPIAIIKNALKPLSIDWLEENKIGVVIGFPVSSRAIEKASVIQKIKSKMTKSISNLKILDGLRVPETLEDLYELDAEETFTLFDTSNPFKPKKIGTGFVVLKNNSRKELIWVSDQRLIDGLERCSKSLQELASKYGEFFEE